MQLRKTLLFSDGEPWVKKDDRYDFDVPMGCYHGAEASKLVGTYLLKENMGLYRDDGLAYLKTCLGMK